MEAIDTKITLYRFMNLEWLSITEVPAKISPKYGELIAGEVLHNCEKIAVWAMILFKVTIRGKEFNIIRKTLGLSMEQLGNLINVQKSTISLWEKDQNKEVPTHVGVIIKMVAIERLRVREKPVYSDLNVISGHDLIGQRSISVNEGSSAFC